ncbi:MAG: hypothetical protein ACJ78H_12755 [Chloroflexota bacterium]
MAEGRTSIIRLVVAMAVTIAVAACGAGSSGPTANSTSPTPPSQATPSESTTSVPSSGQPVTQTDTDWGRIWDRLPAGFPTIPGATPDEEAGGTPASAVLVVEGADAKGIATSLQRSLHAAGYTAVGSLEPLEDGSVVLDMSGQPEGCVLQATATPTGGLTTIRILYGVGCPNA